MYTLDLLINNFISQSHLNTAMPERLEQNQ
jgi:hypothetical protein